MNPKDIELAILSGLVIIALLFFWGHNLFRKLFNKNKATPDGGRIAYPADLAPEKLPTAELAAPKRQRKRKSVNNKEGDA